MSISVLKAQDTTLFKKTVFCISAGGYYQSIKSRDIDMPISIKETRSFTSLFNPQGASLSDNPLLHGPSYIGINSKTNIVKGIDIYGNLIAEHRGFSYGVNSTKSILIYPQIILSIDKEFTIFKNKVKISGKSGHLIDPILYEGLTIYNTYQQGHDYAIRYKKLKYRHVHIGDFYNGLGLNINDSFDNLLELEDVNLTPNLKINIKAGYSYYPQVLKNSFYTLNKYNNDLYNFSIALKIKENKKIYGQVSNRPFNNFANVLRNEYSALLIGFKNQIESKKIKGSLTLEGRYYGHLFNIGYNNTNVYYRDPQNYIIYANTIGEQFYPMFLYDRHFSQWSVYTEYQNKNLTSLIAQIDLNYFFYKNAYLSLNLDINYIQENYQDNFTYPFYNLSLGYQILQDNFIEIGMSNKSMNLDIHYPTFYLLKNPGLFLNFKKNLPRNWYN